MQTAVQRLRTTSRKQLCTPEAIALHYQKGGELFVRAVEEFGTNERREKIILSGWYREYLLLIGDFRVPETYTTGCSQVGKTLGHTALNCYCIAQVGLNTLWSYDQFASMRIQVKSNFRPVIYGWLDNASIVPDKKDSEELQLFQLHGATAQFVAVSTTRTVSTDGTAVAGGGVVGVSRDILFMEERSQCKVGSTEPLKRRLDAGRLPSRPIREIGTSGSGMGIELQVEHADYNFYPHALCPHCESVVTLDPKGCLLKSVMAEVNGERSQRFLSDVGRPIEWFHHDPNEPVKTAYFGCPYCDGELVTACRADAWFADIKTGVRLLDVLQSLPLGVPEDFISAGITLSPLLRVDGTNIASQIIREGLETYNSADWQQQRLGCPSETSQNSISLQMLTAAIAAPLIERKADYRLCGIDMGRAEDWMVVVDFYLPRDWINKSITEITETTIRQIVYGSSIGRSRIPSMLSDLAVEHGLIDNEPSRESAMKICRDTVLEMVDQVSYAKEVIRLSEVADGGEFYSCWQIRNEKFLELVLEGFMNKIDGHSLYRLPKSWQRWVGNPSDASPLVHLMGPYRDLNGEWFRGKGNIDDMYMACAFAEAAFYLKLLMPKPDYTIRTAGVRPVRRILQDL